MKREFLVTVLCCMVVVASVGAAPPKAFKAEVQGAGSMLALGVPVRGAVGAYLVVAGPNDFRVERTFTANEPIAVNLGQLKDAQGQPVVFADGDYKWELRLNTPSPEGAAGAPAVEVPGPSSAAGPKAESWVASGRFKVQGGGIIPIGDEPKGKLPTSLAAASSGGAQATAIGGSGAEARGIAVHPMTSNPGGNFFSGSLFSSGGVCSGCSDGDTDLHTGELLVKDTVPWVTMRDTNDNQRWLFSSDAGPLNLSTSRLDTSGYTTPLVIEKDTPDSTLHVGYGGVVGIGTSTPSTAWGIEGLDIVQPLFPAVRLNKSGSANKFALYATATTIGIFDETALTTPFAINQGAPEGSLAIASSGNVGIGTSSPTYQLHVKVPANTYNGIVATSSDASGTGAGALFGAIANWGSLGFQVHGSARTISRYGITLGGWAEINQATGGNGLILATRTSTPLVFATNTTERVRILSNGNVGIGTSAPDTTLQVVGDIKVGTTGTNGCVKNNAGTGLVGTCSSDARLKTNVRPFEPVLDRLARLQPVHFTWKAAEFPEYHFGVGLNSGLIAQDVEPLFPDMVATDEHGFKMINYSELPYLTLAAVRELHARLQQRDGAIR